MNTKTGTAAGVPFTAIGPDHADENTPLVVVWHMLDAPRTDAAMAAALPLNGLNAWRVYLGLPMSGSRTPEGGWEPLFDDVVLKIYDPITRQAAEEFPAALAELRKEFGEGPLYLVGGSLGAAVALEALASGIPAQAAALISPVVQLSNVVAANEKAFGMAYEWNEQSTAVAQRLDFLTRAKEIDVPVLIVTGEEDDKEGFLEPAEKLWQTLPAGSASLVTVPGMGHGLAEEPGMEPAPQTPHAAHVDGIVAQWLGRQLAA
ncbi:MAG TPA: alpha/beta hydrolase [Micromonosporaceae bacterium]|nr:alpha/beta hydrolase [Micromonosporaceae bacterium]HCU50961.1 alpha/beta hydrolase [Micromonosporaceae bacterium]